MCISEKKKSTPLPSVAIVGGGIAGLTLALFLSRRGIKADVFDKNNQFSEKGFGLQISPNASRLLDKIGVLDQLENVWFEPKEFRFLSGSTLKQLSNIPCRDYARNHWGSPYGVVRRETLQKILISLLKSQPLTKLHFSTYITNHSLAEIAPIAERDFDLLVGADGVHSNIRQRIENRPSLFSGNIALRFIVPKKDIPKCIDRHSINLFFGPDSHLVAYPLENESINVVAISSKNHGEISLFQNCTNNILNPCIKELFLKRFIDWHEEIRAFIATAQNAYFYPLIEHKCEYWHNARDTVLIGDAAHSMMPFAAQGANMAIEDAYMLSCLLSKKKVAEAITTYQSNRFMRIDRVYSRTKFNASFYHLRGLSGLCRDIALRISPRRLLTESLNWIYKYEVPCKK
ncbi:FAD-dependent oxidoreductase [Candidatus Liberibacter sp.]|uniref:FAD-dependent oxidoreductase n=1 Tax=Candidatus Liberibacter sp. TaxID=34022 RepID=UPI0015F41350|nr:FAD-dependent oxidoreductase [Candidatus Liberibacter sp.]MBA5724119.1 FAD-dependent monooxygenase [Candidatus Liberibacter sp.]